MVSRTVAAWASRWKADPGLLEGLGDGWAGLLDRLAEDLSRGHGWNGALLRGARTRCGALRFYTDCPAAADRRAFYERVYAAEDESRRRCEVCGEEGTPRRQVRPATLRSAGLQLSVRVLCPLHALAPEVAAVSTPVRPGPSGRTPLPA